MARSVAILGGGVAGMSAAHELVERGFDVQVFELHPIPGGKARSLAVPLRQSFANVGSVHLPRLAGARRKHLPGEHGFRFFPRFYKHVVDTMSRIPFGRYGSVGDNLVDTTSVQLARFGRRPLLVPARFPHSLDDLRVILDDFLAVFTSETGIPFEEKTFFAERVWQILTSCDERRLGEYEKLAWWDFVGAESRSAPYQKLLASGITRSLVASKARVASTKTIGDIFVQLLFNIAEPGMSSDRVLDGPTSEVWIDPWLAYLQERGVDYSLNSRVTRIDVAGGRVVGAHVRRAGMPVEVQADYYVAALPVDVMATLVDDGMLLADPSLANLKPLSSNVEWMNGVQLYLDSDVPMNHGHVLYVDSPWALTSISQMQFWPRLDLSQYGSGRARGIISIDISDWGTAGLNGKAARECSADEIRDEVWEQLKRSVNVGSEPILRDEMLVDWFVDSDIDVVARANSEPLLVNLVNSWALRPDATTRIPNLFLASDYVRTYTDLATMEAANEAARRAVNGILDAADSGAQRCAIWKLHDPEFLEPWRALDRSRYQQGLPWSDVPASTTVALANAGERLAAGLQQQVSTVTGTDPALEQLRPLLDALLARPDVLAQLTTVLSSLTELWSARGSLVSLVAALNELRTLASAMAPDMTVTDAIRAASMAAASGARVAQTPAGAPTPASEPSPGRVRFVSP